MSEKPISIVMIIDQSGKVSSSTGKLIFWYSNSKVPTHPPVAIAEEEHLVMIQTSLVLLKEFSVPASFTMIV